MSAIHSAKRKPARKRSQEVCSLKDCGKPQHNHGLCRFHDSAVASDLKEFGRSAFMLMNALSTPGVEPLRLVGQPFVDRCFRFLNDAARHWEEDVAAIDARRQRKLKIRRLAA